ncbi:type IV toxin-antitoxin system AbiEi family antitoxin domain-containing protein [Pseudomonas schmalbachii]|uniref:type IV toxin-antitoxin system AbiEi family antitoxin domain-containing protein n=1 Tax=Pseudomonas schmalbachii TaxID=2816993 RepID=UPI0038B632E9
MITYDFRSGLHRRVGQATREEISKGRPFTLKRFNSLGSQAQETVGKAITRMVQSGELERVCRGV